MEELPCDNVPVAAAQVAHDKRRCPVRNNDTQQPTAYRPDVHLYKPHHVPTWSGANSVSETSNPPRGLSWSGAAVMR